VLGFIDQFYKTADENENAAPSRQDDLARSQTTDFPTVDRAFQEQVWRWLTKHPDVQVSRDRRGNKMSLSAVEALSLGKDVPSSSTPLPQSAKVGGAMRIYVTEERMWLAISGHSKDVMKVLETEFILLSIIATHREGGILQADLVRKSGQDKRSVPKRTDMLRDKGYVEKRAVVLKGMKTSRLVHWKFASNGVSKLFSPESASLESHGDVRHEFRDLYVLVRGLFAVLKEKAMVTRADLKKELAMTTRWHTRTLRRIINKFEAIGCVRRVKAASEASKKVRYYFDCVKLIREPSEHDMKAFESAGNRLVIESEVEETYLEDEDDPNEAMARPTSGIVENQLQEIGRVVPQWNPDRLLVNSLLDVVHWAGVQGFTNRVCKLSTVAITETDFFSRI
jgi:B-block binding subunit of TFIIIC